MTDFVHHLERAFGGTWERDDYSDDEGRVWPGCRRVDERSPYRMCVVYRHPNGAGYAAAITGRAVYDDRRKGVFSVSASGIGGHDHPAEALRIAEREYDAKIHGQLREKVGGDVKIALRPYAEQLDLLGVS